MCTGVTGCRTAAAASPTGSGSKRLTAPSPTTRPRPSGSAASTPWPPRPVRPCGADHRAITSGDRRMEDPLTRPTLARAREGNPLPEGTLEVGIGLVLAGLTAYGFT